MDLGLKEYGQKFQIRRLTDLCRSKFADVVAPSLLPPVYIAGLSEQSSSFRRTAAADGFPTSLAGPACCFCRRIWCCSGGFGDGLVLL